MALRVQVEAHLVNRTDLFRAWPFKAFNQAARSQNQYET